MRLAPRVCKVTWFATIRRAEGSIKNAHVYVTIRQATCCSQHMARNCISCIVGVQSAHKVSQKTPMKQNMVEKKAAIDTYVVTPFMKSEVLVSPDSALERC